MNIKKLSSTERNKQRTKEQQQTP